MRLIESIVVMPALEFAYFHMGDGIVASEAEEEHLRIHFKLCTKIRYNSEHGKMNF